MPKRARPCGVSSLEKRKRSAAARACTNAGRAKKSAASASTRTKRRSQRFTARTLIDQRAYGGKDGEARAYVNTMGLLDSMFGGGTNLALTLDTTTSSPGSVVGGRVMLGGGNKPLKLT